MLSYTGHSRHNTKFGVCMGMFWYQHGRMNKEDLPLIGLLKTSSAKCLLQTFPLNNYMLSDYHQDYKVLE